MPGDVVSSYTIKRWMHTSTRSTRIGHWSAPVQRARTLVGPLASKAKAEWEILFLIELVSEIHSFNWWRCCFILAAAKLRKVCNRIRIRQKSDTKQWFTLGRMKRERRIERERERLLRAGQQASERQTVRDRYRGEKARDPTSGFWLKCFQ